MRLTKIVIKNYRNFEDVEVAVSNKNVFFGMNDVGKSNFMCALRLLFDGSFRRKGIIDTDYHKKDTENSIVIRAEFDLGDHDDDDTSKLRAKMKGCLADPPEGDVAAIELTANYNEKELDSDITMRWGSTNRELETMKQSNYRFESDNVFRVVFFDSYLDLDAIFKKNVSRAIKGDDDQDSEILGDINEDFKRLNSRISALSGVKTFETEMTKRYAKIRKGDTSIALKSEIAVKGLYSNIVPYIKTDESEETYPTSGDGRRKLVSYALLNYLADLEDSDKINIVMIEEVENHLHKALQMSLSKAIFSGEGFRYLFAVTHSPYMLAELDEVQLVRVYCADKVTASSSFYAIPSEYASRKRTLNRALSEAVFADKVLLVEGESEVILFDRVLSHVDSDYEASGCYILAVNGVGFDTYLNILKELNIDVFVRTDNDLRKAKNAEVCEPLGFSRCYALAGIDKPSLSSDLLKNNADETKRAIYDQNEEALKDLESSHHIYLARVDLENDLEETLSGGRLGELTGRNDSVDYLQGKKVHRMNDLIEKLTAEDCKAVFESERFRILKEFINA